MKKQVLTLAAALSLTTINVAAQTTLPYYTGFDNTTQKSGWVYFGEGLQDPLQAGWIYNSITPKSAPQYLYHTYWGDAPSLTKDWIISPPFDFSGGAILKCAIMPYAFPAITTNDSINLYLLKGDQNPAIATKILLGTFAQKAKQSYAWDSTGVINIPPTSGTSYIAFKYVGLNEWFEVGIDDLHITAGTTSAGDINAEREVLRFYPNPAVDFLYWNLNQEKIKVARILDITGKELMQFNLDLGKLEISSLPPGLYIIEAGNQRYKFTK